MNPSAILRRWQTEHVPVLIRSADYLDVVGVIQRNLERSLDAAQLRECPNLRGSR